MKREISRRDFVKSTAGLSLAALGVGVNRIYAEGTDKIRVGLIGCGGRGTAAALNCIEADKAVEIVAMGDLFRDRVDASLGRLSREADDRVTVTNETSFVGFNAYKKVIACDIDMVILATPPYFRPIHLKAAVEAGKNVFMEKPVAVDPVGVRSVIESSNLAKQKGLAIVAGTQRRHQTAYQEIMKRIHNGQIGQVVAGFCHWVGSDLWVKIQQPGWSDMEWQCRNWLYFTWLSGDHIVEQHIHNLDIMNWAIGSHPIQCMGMGGREVRTGHEYGNIFDHFAVEYEYPNGVRVMSMCRQAKGCSNQVSERVIGTKGHTYTDQPGNCYIEGQNAYKYDGPEQNPLVQEHVDLIESIRAGKPLNEGVRVAESTLTAIMGRMSAYTGRALKWDWAMNASKLDLSPEKYKFCDMKVRPVSVPGKTPLI